MSNIISKKTRNQKSYIIEELHLYDLLLDSREIFLHGSEYSEEDSGVDFRMSSRFLKNMRLLESISAEPIIIHQQSVGGEWHDGMLIYDMISNSNCHIIFVMHGIACSMGSIIPQAADTRVIMPSCTFMVHSGYTSISSDLTYKQSRSLFEIEEKLQETMLDIYCSVCRNGHIFQKEQLNDKQIREFIIGKIDQKEDWWLLARDAVNYGFADAVFGDLNYENIENIKELISNG